MKLVAEPKRLGILGILVVLAGYFVYTGVFSGPSTPTPSGTGARTPAIPRIEQVAEPGKPVPRPDPRSRTKQAALQDFKPSLKPAREGEQVDLSSIDPTLRLDLLAKLADIQLQGGNRSLFEFSTPPAPPEPKVVPAVKVQTVPLPPPPPPPPEAERKPPPPPIPLKFFGYTTAFKQGNRRGFFMDGDQILVGSEGEVLKKRYRVVRIGVNSVVMEDLEFKAEQTLPLEPQVG